MNMKEKLTALSLEIGNTPIIQVGEVFAKLEGRNPAGSVKDRVGFYIVKDAVERGLVREGGLVVEATSGNTGIGLAYATSALNIGFVAVMPDNMTVERINLMKKIRRRGCSHSRKRGHDWCSEKGKRNHRKWGIHGKPIFKPSIGGGTLQNNRT